MQHFILRCKHCNKEYTYCTYGNGPEYGTEAGCSMEYCAECQKAIDEAFAKIKVKFEPRYVEIQPTFGLDKILEGIKKEKKRKKKRTHNCLLLPIVTTITATRISRNTPIKEKHST